MKAKLIVLLTVCLFIKACAPKPSEVVVDYSAGDDGPQGGISEVPNPTSAMAKASGFSVDQLERGHVIYMLKCGECHAYELPENLDTEDWQDVMPEMIQHAGLPKDDEKSVLNYIIAVKTVNSPTN